MDQTNAATAADQAQAAAPRTAADALADLQKLQQDADANAIPVNVHTALQLLTEGVGLLAAIAGDPAPATDLADRVARVELLLTEAGLAPKAP